MGERPLVHLVDGYGSDTACGQPWRDVPATLITRDATCPACWTAYRLKRPTVLTMDGEMTTTGEDDIGRCPATRTYNDGNGPPETIRCSGPDGHGWQHRFAGETWLADTEPSCHAPTPRSP